MLLHNQFRRRAGVLERTPTLPVFAPKTKEGLVGIIARYVR